MAKWANDDAMDAMLDKYALCTTLLLCSSQPADRAAALAAALADVTVTPGDGNGDFTIANGDSSGRKLTVAAQSSVDVDTSGTGTHVCGIDGTDLWFVTTCNSKVVADTDQVNFPAFDIEVGDPT